MKKCILENSTTNCYGIVSVYEKNPQKYSYPAKAEIDLNDGLI
jgi:hypothetical protein